MSNLPAENNPIRSAFDRYRQETPIATRTFMCIQVVAFFTNLVCDLISAFANNFLFTIYKLELYRIVTSLFLCPSFFGLIFAYYSFLPTGKRLEISAGSVVFVVNFFLIGVVSNVLYLVSTCILDSLVVGQYWIIKSSFGSWNSFFGLLALECTNAHNAREGSMRKFFYFSIPTIQYPLALWAVFSLLGGYFSLAHIISIGIGYGIGYGHFDGLVVSKSTCKHWEDTYLGNLADRKGFITSSSATEVWEENETSEIQSSGFHNLLSKWMPQQDHRGSRSSVEPSSFDNSIAGAPRPGRVITSPAHIEPTMPNSGGQQLGGRSRRQNIDHQRQARLNAIEQRMGIDAE